MYGTPYRRQLVPGRGIGVLFRSYYYSLDVVGRKVRDIAAVLAQAIIARINVSSLHYEITASGRVTRRASSDAACLLRVFLLATASRKSEFGMASDE